MAYKDKSAHNARQRARRAALERHACGCGCGQMVTGPFAQGHHMIARKKRPTCHPDREYQAMEMCRPCYDFANGIKYQFGLTVQQFRELERRQNAKCAICGRANSQVTWGRKAKGLVVDHDAKTGLIRGLLCDFCNCGLGSFYDDPRLLANAIRYLAENAQMAPTIPPRTARQRERRRWPQLVGAA